MDAQQLAIVSGEFAKRKKSTGLAYVLLLLFGMPGVHRFYVGSTGWGIIYLCSLGLVGFGILWDLAKLASMVQQKNEAMESQIVMEVLAAR